MRWNRFFFKKIRSNIFYLLGKVFLKKQVTLRSKLSKKDWVCLYLPPLSRLVVGAHLPFLPLPLLSCPVIVSLWLQLIQVIHSFPTTPTTWCCWPKFKIGSSSSDERASDDEPLSPPFLLPYSFLFLSSLIEISLSLSLPWISTHKAIWSFIWMDTNERRHPG